MPSSLTGPHLVDSAAPSLLTLVAGIVDHWHRRGVRRRLPALLAVGMAAVATGAQLFTAMAEWVNDPRNTAVTGLGVDLQRRPSKSTIRRAFSQIDANHLNRILGVGMWTTTAMVAGRRVMALDGETVRGARNHADPYDTAPHVVSALEHYSDTVLGQLQVTANSNESPALRDLRRDAYPDRHSGAYRHCRRGRVDDAQGESTITAEEGEVEAME